MRVSWRLAAAIVATLAAVSPAATESTPANGAQKHQVVNGESLWGIAAKYGANVDELVGLNNLTFPDLILPGDVIQIPARPNSPPAGGEYEVQPGDTVSHIAVRFDVKIEDLREANQLANIDLIVPGQRLKIPGAPDPTPAAPEPVRHPPQNAELEALFNEIAATEGLDPGLVKAVAWLESGWQQEVVSPAGAVGFMQVTPVTAQWLEQSVFGEQLNEDVSVYDNVKMGARYLRILLGATGGEDKAIASYYQGYGTTMSGKMYEETTHYVKLVRAVQERYWPRTNA
ncbi:MAG: lytic transglycosylase [bacterium]